MEEQLVDYLHYLQIERAYQITHDGVRTRFKNT